MAKILVIDDEESICWGLSQLCSRLGLDCEVACSIESALPLLQQFRFETVVMDVRLPGMDGLSAIRLVHEQQGRIPVITITAFGDLSTAIRAVQNGAFEYIVKPFELDQVRKTIEQAIAVRKIESGTGQPLSPNDERGLVGSSPLMQEVYKHIALTTTNDSPVLLTGESGTGKELAARSIHRFGKRGNGPFVAVNIAALNPSLAESELFGHAKGAFTGADAARSGLIQQANGGTLFLDEVAEIPIEIQVKLLRALDQGEVTPVGSNTPVAVDFRLVSATHRDLASRINSGDFRHDLFYRLRTFEIHLPPLRKRAEDIPELVKCFLARSDAPPAVSSGFIEKLQNHAWPGNVRQLRSVVDRAAILARGGVLTPEHVETVSQPTFTADHEGSRERQLQQLAAEWIESRWNEGIANGLYEAFLELVEPPIFGKAFELCDQQYAPAARRLGIHRTTFKKKLDQLRDQNGGS